MKTALAYTIGLTFTDPTLVIRRHTFGSPLPVRHCCVTGPCSPSRWSCIPAPATWKQNWWNGTRTWPFDEVRTQSWFIERAEMSLASVERFGLPASQVNSLQEELRCTVTDWCPRWQPAFPPVMVRESVAPTRLRSRARSGGSHRGQWLPAGARNTSCGLTDQRQPLTAHFSAEPGEDHMPMTTPPRQHGFRARK